MDLTAILICSVCFFILYKIWDRTASRRERFKFLETISTFSPEQLESFKQVQPEWTLTVKKGTSQILRPACLLLGLGLGLFVAWLINQYLVFPVAQNNSLFSSYTTGLVTLGCPILFGGLGLFVAFMIEQKLKK